MSIFLAIAMATVGGGVVWVIVVYVASMVSMARLIGVGLLGWAAPASVAFAVLCVPFGYVAATSFTGQDPSASAWRVIFMVWCAASAIIDLVLVWVSVRPQYLQRVRGQRQLCCKCAYPLPGGRFCPECGTPDPQAPVPADPRVVGESPEARRSRRDAAVRSLLETGRDTH